MKPKKISHIFKKKALHLSEEPDFINQKIA